MKNDNPVNAGCNLELNCETNAAVLDEIVFAKFILCLRMLTWVCVFKNVIQIIALSDRVCYLYSDV